MEPTIPSAQIVAPPELFKFLRFDMRSPIGTGKWTVGRWRSVRGEIVPCRKGLHATTAANMIPFLSDTLWRVEIGSEYVWHGKDGSSDHKIVARRMRLIERVETWNEQTMRLFAADCAERALHLFEEKYPGDNRPRETIEFARRYARGEATRADLNAASTAAAAAAAVAHGAHATAPNVYAAAYAALAAANVTYTYSAVTAAHAAAYAAFAVASDTAAYAATYAQKGERAWQDRRLAAMLGLSLPAGAAS